MLMKNCVVQADVAMGELNTSKWVATITLWLEVKSFIEAGGKLTIIHHTSTITFKVAHPSAVQANENVAEVCTLYLHFVVTFSSQRGSHFYGTDVKFLKWAWWFVLTVHCSTPGWHVFCYSRAIAPNIHIGECKRSQWFQFQAIHESQKTRNHFICKSLSRVRMTVIAVNANHSPVHRCPQGSHFVASSYHSCKMSCRPCSCWCFHLRSTSFVVACQLDTHKWLYCGRLVLHHQWPPTNRSHRQICQEEVWAHSRRTNSIAACPGN